MIISRKYEVLEQLGKGGMGVVYKVRHVTLDTIFALKALPRDLMENPEMVSRFYREARMVARLSHPHIVRVSDIDHDDELKFHYFVMEYIQGQTFAQYLRDRGPLPLPDVLTIARQVAKALIYAHGHTPPIIHRDIKPANIMIEDRTERVVVMDFGIAKELDNSEMTKSGMVIGTLRYCAPEQMRRESLDGRADIYSLGMVMYEACTGGPFFVGLDEAEVIGKVLYDPQEYELVFPRPVPPAFAALVKKAIAKSRDRRHRTLEEFLRELDACNAVNADTTERIILPSPVTSFSSGGKTGEGVKDLEEQIRRLEEERQRRLVLSAQTQAQEARERAAQTGAARWALPLFQAALTREEAGHAYLRDQQYPQAQEAYEDAERLFTQAFAEASAAAVFHKAEQSRQEMTAVKLEADRYGAREKARTFYGRGLVLQARADELWEQNTYQEAEQRYTEARSIFSDARDLAYRETFREEAIIAQMEMRAVRETAEKEEAGMLATESFQLAMRAEEQAAAAMQDDEFRQARELYNSARQQYLLAQQQAHAEQQRQHAPAATEARLQMEAARAAVEAYREQSQFATPLAQAHQFEEQGRVSEQQGEFANAGSLYDFARREYEQIREAVEQERRKLRELVVKARAEALTVKEKAEAVGAADSGREAFTKANKNEYLANAALARGDFASARESYLSAAREFALAEQQALAAQQRLHAQEEKRQLQEQQKTPTASPLEERQVLSLPSLKGAPGEGSGRPTRMLSLPWALTGVGLLLIVGGFYWITNARSVTPQLPAASLDVPPTTLPASSQPERQEILSPVATPGSLPSSMETADVAFTPPKSPQFIESDRITKYTDIPSAHIQAAVSDAAHVFLDGREISAPTDGVLQIAFSDLPVGESKHLLRLVGEMPERTQEIPVVVRYYPRWEIRQFVDEHDEAYAVAFSPDGHVVASTSRDKVVKLWDKESGQKIRTLVGHGDWVTGVAFSPDGQTILSCSDDKTVRLWEVATGKLMRRLTGHRDFVNGVAFSPDGKMAVSGSKDKTLKLWNMQTGKEIRTLTGHSGWVLTVAFSPDGKSVLSGGNDAMTKLWDVKTGHVLRTFSGHRDAVFSVAFAPDGKTVLSGSHDKTIRLWDVKTGQVLRTFSGHEDWVNGVVFSPDGQTLVSGGKDKTVRLWSVATGQAVRIFVGHEATVAGVAFSPDGEAVLSASRDKTLRLWWAALETPPEPTSTLATAPPSIQ